MADPSEVPKTEVVTAPAQEQVDLELLEEARRQIQGGSANQTINEALRRLVDQERAKRREAMERLWKMHDEGRFDYSKLEAADE